MSLVVALLLGCSIDDRDPAAARVGSRSPEAAASGQVNGGPSSPEAGVTGPVSGGPSSPEAGVVGQTGVASPSPEAGVTGQVSGGSGNGLTCVGAECGCALQPDGGAQLDCGGGVCVLDRENACCPGSAPAGCHCDLADNQCKECLANEHCTNGPGGSVGQCNVDRTCSYPCEPGFKSCQASCIANAECCGGCAEGEQCQSGQCRINDGATCSATGTVCSSGNCSAGRCCPLLCGASGCNAEGSCECPTAEQFARGACRRINGQTCANDDQCINGCTSWFEDSDADGFGNPESAVRRVCGPQAPNVGVSLASNADDCCDASALIRPTQTEGLAEFSLSDVCPVSWKNHDYDCDDQVRYHDAVRDLRISPSGSCSDADNPGIPCAQRSNVFAGPANPLGFTEENIFSGGDASQCGNSSLQWETCATSGGVCTATIRLSPTCL